VDGKLFCVTRLEAGPVRLSFKCSPESFVELCERDGVVPAPYLAQAQWVALEQLNTLGDAELRELLAEAYRLIWQRISPKRRAELEKAGAGPSASNKAQAAKRRVSKPAASKKSKAARKSPTPKSRIAKTRKKQ
jgi:predicted DNA-binding protein (MmcQ/YjbR family)